ncbi:M48 family metalloprotease [Prescottella defluvii]|nr:M48 family metalloprotease [Prescottella defluvii]
MHACEHLARILVGQDSDPTARYAAAALVTAAVVALALTGVRLARNLSASRRSTHGHARAARLVGRPIAGHDAVVLDAPQRAAYCVAGRPNAIVVTSAALDALDDGQLGAVLAHERAHLTGRHPQVLAVVRALADSVPTIDVVHHRRNGNRTSARDVRRRSRGADAQPAHLAARIDRTHRTRPLRRTRHGQRRGPRPRGPTRIPAARTRPRTYPRPPRSHHRNGGRLSARGRGAHARRTNAVHHRTRVNRPDQALRDDTDTSDSIY